MVFIKSSVNNHIFLNYSVAYADLQKKNVAFLYWKKQLCLLYQANNVVYT